MKMEFRVKSFTLIIPVGQALLGFPAHASVPNSPSIVTVSGRQILVQKRMPDGSLSASAPYIMKGVNWMPATQAPTVGPDPTLGNASVPYGFFFDGSWRSGLQGH